MISPRLILSPLYLVPHLGYLFEVKIRGGNGFYLAEIFALQVAVIDGKSYMHGWVNAFELVQERGRET